jgi:hypothetical protein
MFDLLQALTPRQLETSQRLQTLKMQQAETVTSLLNAQSAQIRLQYEEQAETKPLLDSIDGLHAVFRKNQDSMLQSLQNLNEFQNIK